MNKTLIKSVIFFVSVIIFGFCVSAVLAQEADPAKRVNQVSIEIMRLDGMITNNTQIRNDLAKSYTNLVIQRDQKNALLSDLIKKAEAAKKADAMETEGSE